MPSQTALLPLIASAGGASAIRRLAAPVSRKAQLDALRRSGAWKKFQDAVGETATNDNPPAGNDPWQQGISVSVAGGCWGATANTVTFSANVECQGIADVSPKGVLRRPNGPVETLSVAGNAGANSDQFTTYFTVPQPGGRCQIDLSKPNGQGHLESYWFSLSQMTVRKM